MFPLKAAGDGKVAELPANVSPLQTLSYLSTNCSSDSLTLCRELFGSLFLPLVFRSPDRLEDLDFVVWPWPRHDDDLWLLL